jgi:hypothetical protein
VRKRVPPDQVPPVDTVAEQTPAGSAVPDRSRYEDIEFRLLNADARAKDNINREHDQRYFLRWLAVIMTVVLMLAMGCLLGHVAHSFKGLSNAGLAAAFLIALYVAPIVSMTTLSLALLVAAFRGYRDGDEKAGFSAATEGMKAAVGLGR